MEPQSKFPKNNYINVNDLAEEVAVRSGVDKKSCKLVINAIKDSIRHHLASKDVVGYHNLGKFGLRLVKGRLKQHPLEHTSLWVPAHYIPNFKWASEIKKIAREIPIDKEQLKDEYMHFMEN